MTAQELIELKSTLRSDLWADRAVEMLRFQLHEVSMLREQRTTAAKNMLMAFEEIDSLKKMLVISDDTHQTWLKANAPGGWIDELRKERDALKADAERYRWYVAQLASGNLDKLDEAFRGMERVEVVTKQMFDAAIDAMKGAS